MTRRILHLLALAALIAGCGSRVGQISGFVQDTTGAVTSAAVEAKIGDTDLLTTSGGDGSFKFDDLKNFGVYTLTGTKGGLKGTTYVLLEQPGWATPPGFRTARAENVVLMLTSTGTSTGTSMGGWISGSVSGSTIGAFGTVIVTVDGLSAAGSATVTLSGFASTSYLLGPTEKSGTLTVRAASSMYGQKTKTVTMPPVPAGTPLPTLGSIDFSFP